MQVYKAWSALARNAANNVCESPPAAPQAIVVSLAPVVIRVHRRRPHHHPPPPFTPAPAPPRPQVATADPAELARWLRAAVPIAVKQREMGSEGLATLFAAHLDGRLAAALTRVRDSGQLGAAIATALRETGVEARPDCPIERILSSALRRYELREWLR